MLRRAPTAVTQLKRYANTCPGGCNPSDAIFNKEECIYIVYTEMMLRQACAAILLAKLATPIRHICFAPSKD